MTTATLPATDSETLEFATFYLGGTLVGVDIRQVQEINRNTSTTEVPHAPAAVRGVINLRGEVVTVIDLRNVLGLDPIDVTSSTRIIVLSSRGERIGLLVDRIADVTTASSTDIDEPPGNFSGMEGRFFQGVLKMDGELLLVLDADEVLS